MTTTPKRKKGAPAEYKFRTRAHIIADLSVNHVERFVILEGHSCERFEKDYGYDLQMFTFENGAFENGFVYLQLKATDDLNLVKENSAVAFPADRADINLWKRETYPVILVVWDAATEIGYWLYMQPYLKNLEKTGKLPLPAGQATVTVHLPITNIVDKASIKKFRQYKNTIQRQIQKVVNHDN